MDIEIQRIGHVTVRRRLSRHRPQPAGPAGILALAVALEVLSLVVLGMSRPGVVAAVALASFCVGDVMIILGWDSPSFPGRDADGPATRVRPIPTTRNR
jgi:hypothetical protein